MSQALSSSSLCASCHCLLFMPLLASSHVLLPGPSAKRKDAVLAESHLFIPQSPIHLLVFYPMTHIYSGSSVLSIPCTRSSRLFQGVHSTLVVCISQSRNGCSCNGQGTKIGCRPRKIKDCRRIIPVRLLLSSICHSQMRLYS